MLLILLAGSSINQSGFGQYGVNNYFFQQQTGTYSEISGGTVLGTINIDEEVFNASTTGATNTVTGPGFPIGFPFAYGGNVFTRFAVGTNGYISLGNNDFSIPNNVSSAFNGIPFNLPDTLNYFNMVAALHCDLQGQPGSELSFQTIGTEPNRECVIQWKKFRVYLSTEGSDDFNFQIRLKENGNRVVFSYGAFVKNANPRLVSVGLRGNIYNVVHMRKAIQLDGETWSSSSKSTDRTKQSDLEANFLPSNGLEYIFYNPAQTAQDIGLDKATLSANILFGCPGTANEPITVRAFNYGDSSQTSLPYQIRINNGAIQNGLIELNPPLAKSQMRTLTLNQTLDLTQPGEVNVKVWSKLPADTGIYAINDTASIQTTVFASASTPSAPIRSYGEFVQKGWKSYRGKTKPKTNDGRFVAGNQFNSGTTSIQVGIFSADTISDWLVSPAFQPNTNLRLKFRAAITGFDTITPLNGGIDNDEIRFLISEDCGNSWNTIYLFDNNSVSGGALSNEKKGFSVPIPAVSGPFQIALHVNNKGTNPSNTYFFHIDDLTLNQGNSYDLGVKKVSIENQNNPNCDQTNFTVKAWIRNEGDSVISSSSVSARVNNGPPQIETFNFNPALQAGDSTQVTFNSVAVTPNSNIKLMVRSLLSSEDGFSSANDTSAIRFVYIGSSNPLPVPGTITFDNLPSGVPAGWLVEQSQGSDFKVRVRGTNSSRSLSTNMYSGNKSSFAIAPTTEVLPTYAGLTFDLRLKNDLAGAFSFGAGDSVTASVSTDCGNSWIEVFKTKASLPFGYDNFQTTANINLSDYAGQVVAVRFDAWINRSDNTGAWVDIDNFGFTQIPIAVDNMILADQISFFPNPAKSELTFKMPASINSATFLLRNLNGKQLLQQEISGGSSLNLSGIPAGIYLTELKTKSGIKRSKLVIE